MNPSANKSKVYGLVLVALGALCGAPLLAQDDPKPAPSKKSEQQLEIERLVLQLGAAKYEAREQAYQQLVKIGAPALGELRKATKSQDPEVAAAASEAIAEIEKQSGKRPQPRPRTTQEQRPGGAPPLPQADQEFFEELEKGLPKDMRSLMERLRKQQGGGNMRVLTPDDPLFKDLLKGFGLGDPDRLERLFRFGQGGQGESEERSGPGWRSRTFRWGNGRPVRPDASKDAGPLLAKRLGMTLRPASAALRAQLQLGRGGVGVVVNKVIPGGWAANNGIEQYDVLIGLGTMPIRRARDLADAETKGGKLLLVRKAKRQTVEVKPLQAAKQPAPGQPEVKPVPSEPKQAPVKKKQRDF
ncbi:MAG TPA: hypothetical protein DEA08_29820 [Planctomycetes bacterium]|nr:hypothetical protein [Planctomycetota bacterium]